MDPKQGYKDAHGFARGSAKAPPMPEIVVSNERILTNSKELAAHYLNSWTELWQQSPKYHELPKEIKMLRDKAAQEPFDNPITGAQVQSAITTI